MVRKRVVSASVSRCCLSGLWLSLVVRHHSSVREDNSNNRKDTKMNSHILGLRVAGTIFGLMCLAQLLRLLTRAEVIVAGHPMPLWPSVVAFIILGV